ncbi:transcription initiation factor TFIID subunit 11-like [Neltuma alba]|uniref:transcription initiation factor TFIID subunit 11-like n=1 Tax=Neltuma alba TaxID=207710 RepID=UPI0010A498B9|nr:transcription initiation factor TFIID subunit 11-like [Prosopis alba]
MEQKNELGRQHSGIWRSLRDEDFEEEEVWDVVNEKPQYNKKNNNSNHHISGIFKTKLSLSSSSSSSSPVPLSVPRPVPSASRMIPKTNSSSNIHTSTYNSAIEGKVVQQSAPVNIPDWSKIYNINNKKKQNKRVSRLHHDFADAEEDDEGDINEQVIKYGGNNNFDEEEDDDNGEDDDEYDQRLPPHEFIARRLARTQISSFSVFEGVGRTLKGRDLSKVRNAVLTKTGFLESL